MLLSFSGDLIYEILNMIDNILKLIPPFFNFLALALLLLSIIKHQSNRLQPCLKLLQQSVVDFMNSEEVSDFFGSQTVQQHLIASPINESTMLLTFNERKTGKDK